MKKINKKAAVLLAAAVMIGSVFTGCGNTGGTANSSQETASGSASGAAA